MQHTSIAVVIPYFGKFPKYLPYFIESSLKNDFIDFLIFTDDKSALRYSEGNVKINYQSVTEFNALVTEKLGLPFALTKGYKLCDLKPVYGKIYEDSIKEYGFWGFSDIDIIFGDLRQLLTEELLANYDIISFYDLFISGPFCLFRNEEDVNMLFVKSKDYERVLNSTEYECFDEGGGMDILWQLWAGIPILETNPPIESFSHVVFNPQKCNKRLHFQKWITDVGILKEVVRYKNGHLYFDEKEIYVYHYLWYKGMLGFNVPPYKKGRDFMFTKNGFFYDDIKSKTIDRALSFANNFSSKAIRKIKRVLH